METVQRKANAGHSGEEIELVYTQKAMVGHGSFGCVHEVQFADGGRAAIKTVLQDRRFKNRELEIMKVLQHRNVVDLLAYFLDTDEKNDVYLHLVLEFLPETLYAATHWFHSRERLMPPLAVKLYSYQLFRSLNYIHSFGICHRDIKPQNLLIDPIRGILKLCDFGSAKILNPDEPNVSYICSRYYRAPELIFGARNYTTKIDVWSTGCVIAEMVLGQPIFPGQSGIDQLVEIIKLLGTPSKDQIRSMNPNYMEHKFPSIKPIPLTKIFQGKGIDEDFINLFQQIFEYSPVKRISAIDCLVHHCFDELKNEEFTNSIFPNYRQQKDGEYQVPELFDYSARELSMDPSLFDQLVPEHLRESLKDFKQYTKEELLDITKV